MYWLHGKRLYLNKYCLILHQANVSSLFCQWTVNEFCLAVMLASTSERVQGLGIILTIMMPVPIPGRLKWYQYQQITAAIKPTPFLFLVLTSRPTFLCRPLLNMMSWEKNLPLPIPHFTPYRSVVFLPLSSAFLPFIFIIAISRTFYIIIVITHTNC